MININLSKNSINEAKEKIINIRKNQSKVDNLFRKVSCRWIVNEANKNLDNSINSGYPIVTEIRNNWRTIDFGNVITLLNHNEISAYVEFGTGKKGQMNPHSKSKIAGYEYNIPTDKKDSQGRWTFKLPNGDYLTFDGYVGKGFLYKAFRKYVDLKVYNEIYIKCFNEINKEFL